MIIQSEVDSNDKYFSRRVAGPKKTSFSFHLSLSLFSKPFVHSAVTNRQAFEHRILLHFEYKMLEQLQMRRKELREANIG